jgi:hypothetical protein
VALAAAPARKPAAGRRLPEEEAPEERPRPARRKAPGRRLVLRIIVLVLGIGGAGVAGFLGFKAYVNTHDPQQIASIEMSRIILKEVGASHPGGSGMDEVRSEVRRFDQLAIVCYFLLASGLLGVAGAVLAFLRWRIIAAPLLLVPPIGAAVIAPVTAVLTSPLMLAGLLALLIRRPPRAPVDDFEE